MTKQEAKTKIKKYLDSEHIEYRIINDTDRIVPLERVDTIYFSCAIEDVIGRRIETSLGFGEDYCYCQSYYCQPIAKTEEKSMIISRLQRHRYAVELHLFALGIRSLFWAM